MGERGWAKIWETYLAEFPCFVDGVDGFEGLFHWGCHIRRVDVVDFYLLEMRASKLVDDEGLASERSNRSTW